MILYIPTKKEILLPILPDRFNDLDEVRNILHQFQTVMESLLNNFSDSKVKDEDNLASDSDEHLATQQSLKAYIDTKVDLEITDAVMSPTILTGGAVSEGTNAGTIQVSALTCLLRTTDSDSGSLAALSKTLEDNIAIPAADITYYVSLNYNAGTPSISIVAAEPNLTQNIPIGLARKKADNTVCFLSAGFRLYDGVSRLHQRVVKLRALELTKGSTITYSGTNNFEMTSGIAYGGINEIALAAYNSATTTFIPVYSDGGAGWTEGTPRNTIDYTHYDDDSGTPASVGVGRYGCHWVYRHSSDGHIYVLLGKDSYKLAEAETAPEPERPAEWYDFGGLVGRIIAPQAGGSFTDVQMVTARIFSGTAVSIHNNMGGLNDGDYVHLTAAEKTTFDGLVSDGMLKSTYDADDDGVVDEAESVDGGTW